MWGILHVATVLRHRRVLLDAFCFQFWTHIVIYRFHPFCFRTYEDVLPGGTQVK